MMGEYAEYELQRAMGQGMPMSDKPPRKRNLVACPDCGKECRGITGVMQHRNAKHGTKFSWQEICAGVGNE